MDVCELATHEEPTAFTRPEEEEVADTSKKAEVAPSSSVEAEAEAAAARHEAMKAAILAEINAAITAEDLVLDDEEAAPAAPSRP